LRQFGRDPHGCSQRSGFAKGEFSSRTGSATGDLKWTIMAHWIDATAEHNRRPLKINADAIAFIIRTEKDGPTHVHFMGSNFAAGKPDLLVLETPEELVSRIQRPR
jgi:hypothetical protein